MAAKNITVTLSLPWWAMPYARMCGFFAALHGLEPDCEKIAARIIKHVKVRAL